MAAALEKIRIPSTTTTAVDSCVPDAELVAEEDDEGRDDGVGQERDDEDAVVEDPVEQGAQRRRTARRARPRPRSAGTAGGTAAPSAAAASPPMTPTTSPSTAITTCPPLPSSAAPDPATSAGDRRPASGAADRSEARELGDGATRAGRPGRRAGRVPVRDLRSSVVPSTPPTRRLRSSARSSSRPATRLGDRSRSSAQHARSRCCAGSRGAGRRWSARMPSASRWGRRPPRRRTGCSAAARSTRIALPAVRMAVSAVRRCPLIGHRLRTGRPQAVDDHLQVDVLHAQVGVSGLGVRPRDRGVGDGDAQARARRPRAVPAASSSRARTASRSGS